jgi:Zn-dependent protease with chaperone function
METLGRVLLGFGLVFLSAGIVFLLFARFGIGRLPGDIVVRRGNFALYAPLGLMIAVSLLLTIVLNLFSRKCGAYV